MPGGEKDFRQKDSDEDIWLDIFNYFLGINFKPYYFLFSKSILKKGDEMKKITAFFIFPLLLLNILGCAPLIIGAAVGAVGGYAVSKDTIQGETDGNYDLFWNSALMVSRIRGIVKLEDYAKGYIDLDVSNSKVWIRLIRLTEATTRIRVSARKYHMPDLRLAQDIYVKILEQAK